MTTRQWVTLHFFFCHAVSSPCLQIVSDTCICLAVSSCLILWPIGSEWQCTFSFSRQCHHVSWPIDSEWHCIFALCQTVTLAYVSFHDKQGVSDIAFFLGKQSHHPMTNSGWVILLFPFQAFTMSPPMAKQSVSDTAFFSFTRQSHHTSCHDWQSVSGSAFFIYKVVSSFLLAWLTVCEWHCFFASISSHLITNRGWVTLHFFSFPDVS